MAQNPAATRGFTFLYCIVLPLLGHEPSNEFWVPNRLTHIHFWSVTHQVQFAALIVSPGLNCFVFCHCVQQTLMSDALRSCSSSVDAWIFWGRFWVQTAINCLELPLGLSIFFHVLSFGKRWSQFFSEPGMPSSGSSETSSSEATATRDEGEWVHGHQP